MPSFSFLGVLSPFLGVLSPFMGVASPFLSGLAGVPFASFFGVFWSFCFFGVELS